MEEDAHQLGENRDSVKVCIGQIPIDEAFNGNAKLNHENRILRPTEISQPPRALRRQADGTAVDGSDATWRA
jgi:hypothetical protein